MTGIDGRGLMPAMTTQFRRDGSVDRPAVRRHVRWLASTGCRDLITLGSLGESSSLAPEEKLAIVDSAVAAAPSGTRILAGIAAPRTEEARRLARECADRGVEGLLVLPQYVYRGDERENGAHVTQVIRATGLPCILYNNPIAYGVDFPPAQIEKLARELSNLVAVKESSGDLRRITSIRHRCGRRLVLTIGVDDLVREAVNAGAEGWVAGLVNALPRECVRLWDLCRTGPPELCDDFYRRLLPLLRLDAEPKFVQLIKFVQAEMGRGDERVRPPRLALSRVERSGARSVLRSALRPRARS